MARPKRTTRRAKPIPSVPSNDLPIPLAQSSGLLALPPEIRLMVWKEAVGGSPVQILAFPRMTSRRSSAPSFACELAPTCEVDHREHRHGTPLRATARRGQAGPEPGPLSWLRTCRQVYLEARQVVATHLCIHICGFTITRQLLAAHPLMQQTTPVPVVTSLPPPLTPTLRCFSLCLRVQIDSGGGDGFVFALGVHHAMDSSWGRHPAQSFPCQCDLCAAVQSNHLTQSTLTEEVFSRLCRSVEELRVGVYFTCREGEGTWRPDATEGRTRSGQSYQDVQARTRPLRARVPLSWIDLGPLSGDVDEGIDPGEHNGWVGIEEVVNVEGDDEEDDGEEEEESAVAKLVGDLCDEVPLKMFLERKLKAVEVVFWSDAIEHNWDNECPHDRCWCLGRRIDAGSLPAAEFERELIKRLVR